MDGGQENYNSQRESNKGAAGNGFYQSILTGGLMDGGLTSDKREKKKTMPVNKSKPVEQQNGKFRKRYQYQE